MPAAGVSHQGGTSASAARRCSGCGHLIVAGTTTKEVATELGVNPKTADNHRTRALRKIGVRNTDELLR